MHRQTHIYVGTLSRRERRWNGRQRTALRLLAVRTAAALGAALAVMAALPGVGN